VKNPAIDAEFVLEHQGYVRRLARSLVFDEAGADDLAQQVWLAALSHPPASESALRGWLATVARNLASSSRRGLAARVQRESAAARGEAVEAADELVLREALRTRIVQSVLALEEPFRETIILRYFDELSPRAIATKQGLGVSTVKSRLKRGLATLRERLDRESGGRAVWRLALIDGLHLGPGTSSLAGFGLKSLASGVVLMTVTKKIAVAVIVLVACFLTWRFVATNPTEAQAVVRDAAPAVALAAQEAAPVAAQASETSRASVPVTIRGKRPVAPAAIGSGPGNLDVRVEMKEDKAPIPGVSVCLWPMEGRVSSLGAEPLPNAMTRVTDATGTAHFTELPPVDYQFTIDRGYEGLGLVRSGITSTVTLQLEDSCSVRGRVVTATGEPVAGADVCIAVRGYDETFDAATADGEGRFRIDGLKPSSVYVFARKSGSALSARQFVRVNPGTTLEVELALRGPDASIAGHVRDEHGAAIANALVVVGNRRPGDDLTSLSYRPDIVDGTLARSDEAGHFALDGLLPGLAWIDCSAAGFRPTREAIELAPGSAPVHDVQMSHGASLSGLVLRADGAPASEARVTVRAAGSKQVQFTTAAADGSYRCLGLDPGESHLTAELREERVESDQVLQDGEESTWSPRLGKGLALDVRVLDEAGDPAKQITVEVRCAIEGREPFAQGQSSSSNGLFHFEGCPDAACDVLVYQSNSHQFQLASARGVTPGSLPIVLTIDPARRPSIYIVGRVVGPDGQALGGSNLATLNSSLDWAVNQLAKEDGSFRAGPYPPGPWGLKVSHDGFASFLAKERELSAKAVWDLGTIRLARGEILEVEFQYPGEPPHATPWFSVRGLDSGIREYCKVEGNRGHTAPLAPGRYEVSVEGTYAPVKLTTDVIAGAKNKLAIALQPGVTFAVRVNGIDVDLIQTIEFRDASGAVAFERNARWRTPTVTMMVCLGPGHYQLTASDPKGRKASLEFDVDASTAQKTIDVTLP